MQLSDIVKTNDLGELIFVFKDDGTFITYTSYDINVECIIVFVSLDCKLTSNIMYHHCEIGKNTWVYDSKIDFISSFFNGDHPGFRIEIYDKSFNKKLFEKNYHSVKKFRCINLVSNRKYCLYSSYYTFFYEDHFLKNFSIKDGDVIYDLGANIGAFSIACSNYNIKKIYAFEPNEECFNFLEKNVSIYGENVQCFNKAISNDFKKVLFGGEDASAIGQSILNIYDENIKFKQEIEAINLEKFVLNNNLELPTYLKIDIEGSEYDFFENTSNEFFKNTHSIFLEFHNNDGKNVRKIVDRLKNLNYKLTCEDSAFNHTINNMNTLYFVK